MGTHASQLLGTSSPLDSTTARLPWTHLGSMGLSQGLLVGKKGRMRTPLPSLSPAELWARIQVRTILLTCQEALSQIEQPGRFPLGLQSGHTPIAKIAS